MELHFAYGRGGAVREDHLKELCMIDDVEDAPTCNLCLILHHHAMPEQDKVEEVLDESAGLVRVPAVGGLSLEATKQLLTSPRFVQAAGACVAAHTHAVRDLDPLTLQQVRRWFMVFVSAYVAVYQPLPHPTPQLKFESERHFDEKPHSTIACALSSALALVCIRFICVHVPSIPIPAIKASPQGCPSATCMPTALQGYTMKACPAACYSLN